MSVKSSIKCNCGQRIVARDVMQTGYYLRLFGPSFVYVKFRCSRCKKLGEQFVKQEEWEDGILKDIPSEVNPEKQQDYQTLGPITVDEQIDFHFHLDDPGLLSKLTEGITLEEAPATETQEDPKSK